MAEMTPKELAAIRDAAFALSGKARPKRGPKKGATTAAQEKRAEVILAHGVVGTLADGRTVRHLKGTKFPKVAKPGEKVKAFPSLSTVRSYAKTFVAAHDGYILGGVDTESGVVLLIGPAVPAE